MELSTPKKNNTEKLSQELLAIIDKEFPNTFYQKDFNKLLFIYQAGYVNGYADMSKFSMDTINNVINNRKQSPK